MSKIIAGIISFILFIFPNCKSALAYQQNASFNKDQVVIEIMDAVTTRDIEALQAMMCKNIKTNVPNLSVKIGELIDAIDGEILEFTPRTINAYYSNSDSGKQISQIRLAMDIEAPTKNYLLSVMWEYVHNFSPDELGIRVINLYDTAIEGPAGLVYGITATEGLFDWHN